MSLETFHHPAAAAAFTSYLLLLQGFNQEDLGVVEKEPKAQKHQEEEESDSDGGLERSGQE